MGIPLIVEYVLGRLLFASRRHDAALLIKQPVLRDVPEAIEVTCDLGPSGSQFRIEHTGLGPQSSHNILPKISWKPNESIEGEVKEYCMVVQDPDSPIPPSIFVAVHGVFYSIPAAKTSINNDDLAIDHARSGEDVKWTKGNFRLGSLLKRTAYSYLGPRPVCGHGEHRYLYQVITLKEPLDISKMGPSAGLAELLRELDGKGLGYGAWVGVYEHKWQ